MNTSFFQKTKLYIAGHKGLSIVVGLMLIFGLYYGIFHKKAATVTRYVTTAVTQGTVISSVTGSGQVSTSNEVSLQPKVSADITYVAVKAGDEVRRGQLLFSLDATNAQDAVHDAQTSLDLANLAMTKLQEPPDDLTVIQTKDAITQATNDKANLALAVSNSYSSLLNSTPEAIPAPSTNGAATPTNYTAPTITGNYTLGKEGQIDVNVLSAGTTSNGYFVVSGLVTGSGNVSSTVPQPLGNSGLFIKFPAANQTVTQWVINLPNTDASNYLSNYNSYQSALQSQQSAATSDDQSIAENTEKLKELNAGTDPVAIQQQQIAIEQAQDALATAQQTLSDYSIVAPFDGTIATVTGELGQPAGTGTALATIITNDQLATVSLNEVDVAKIKLGEKATLTFDAIPNLTIAGEVASIDAVGTVSSGVVNYNVDVDFATQNQSIKPGMSVSAAIVTAVDQNVLVVPNSAVKTQNGASYVQVFNTPLPAPVAGTTGSVSAVPPMNVPVQVGLSDDTNTEITSGLTAGQLVVSRVVTSGTTTTAAATAAPSLLGGAAAGRGAGGGGNFRGGGGL